MQQLLQLSWETIQEISMYNSHGPETLIRNGQDGRDTACMLASMANGQECNSFVSKAAVWQTLHMCIALITHFH